MEDVKQDCFSRGLVDWWGDQTEFTTKGKHNLSTTSNDEEEINYLMAKKMANGQNAMHWLQIGRYI
jgi:hypothetical protein